MLAIRDTGDGSNAASLEALGHKVAIRKGRSLGLAACYDVIDQLGGTSVSRDRRRNSN